MQIVEKSRDFEAKEQFKLTSSKYGESISKLEDGTPLRVTGYIKFHDEVDDQDILALETNEGIYKTMSSVFKRSFDEIVTSFGAPVEIKKVSGKSKAGRIFVDCEIM